MSAPPRQRLPPGHTQFVRYAYPPNELGYCGPADSTALLRGDRDAVAAHAQEFDGTWPYLRAIADAAEVADPLDAEVVRSYWVGGPLLSRLESGALLDALRRAFAGQVTGVLTELTDPSGVLAHHSFHVFVVYPWIRFLDRATDTALGVLQNCRIRWGTVDSVDDGHVAMWSRPLTFDGGVLALGEPVIEHVRWREDGVSLVAAPRPGDTVAGHWNWVCDILTDADRVALADATDTTLGVVNAFRSTRELAVRPRRRYQRRAGSPAAASAVGPGEIEGDPMNTSGEHLSEEPQEARGAPGSRDTGSDQPSGGPTDRPSGTYEGDESVPDHSAHGKPGSSGSEKTEHPPGDAEPAVPPYEGRQTTAKPEGSATGGQGSGGAVKPTTEG